MSSAKVHILMHQTVQGSETFSTELILSSVTSAVNVIVIAAAAEIIALAWTVTIEDCDNKRSQRMGLFLSKSQN